jgi:hypothetical protein
VRKGKRPAAASAARGGGELPPGWEQGRTPDGKVFFVDTKRKRTTWLDPRAQQDGAAPETGLPYGWEVAHTKDGVPYFINHSTQVGAAHGRDRVGPERGLRRGLTRGAPDHDVARSAVAHEQCARRRRRRPHRRAAADGRRGWPSVRSAGCCAGAVGARALTRTSPTLHRARRRGAWELDRTDVVLLSLMVLVVAVAVGAAVYLLDEDLSHLWRKVLRALRREYRRRAAG